MTLPRSLTPGAAPLSSAQLRMWFHSQLEPLSPLYNSLRATRWRGSLDIRALERALAEIVRRHDVLRTRFRMTGTAVVQEVSPPRPFSLPLVDLTELPPNEREEECRRRLITETRLPFDLTQGPILRMALFRLAPEEHVLMLVIHHIATDASSDRILLLELTTLYQAFVAGDDSPLADPPIQYQDYAIWQWEQARGEGFDRQLAYWKERLRGMPAVLELAMSSRSEQDDHADSRVSFDLTADLVERLAAVGRQERATPFMILLASFKVLLWRYTGQTDLSIGVPVAGRTQVEFEQALGCFTNTLVLRTDLSGDPSFRELLRRVRNASVGGYANQDYPFEKLVEELRPERSVHHHPLFQVMFNFRDIPAPNVEIPGLSIEEVTVPRVHALVDLALRIDRRGNGLSARVACHPRVFDEAGTRRFVEHYRTLLEGVASDPDQRVSRLPVLTEGERHQALVEWQGAARAGWEGPAVHQLVEAQAARTPGAVAVVYGEERLTYAELNRAANRIAHRLRSLGVGRESRVGLCAGASLELLVGVLAILKAGGAYLPLDPAFPRDRIAWTLEDAGAEVLLLGPGGPPREWFEPLPARIREVHRLDVDAGPMDAESDANPDTGVAPDNLAYVMYTSGSTGRPKGVAAHHRAVVNFVRGAAEAYGLSSSDRVLHLASISSDISTDEIFPAWSSGAAVVLAGRLSPGADFTEYLRERRVTAVSLATAFWHAWVQELHQSGQVLPPDLRLVIVGGEQVQSPLCTKWRALDRGRVRLINTYGPTETTVQATLYELTSSIPSEAPGRVPIGRPAPNVRAYVVDRHLNLLPAGAAGELCIGGSGVSRGYLGRPSLTAAAFVPDPISGDPGGRLYRTGDRVRLRSDGELEFLGRIDHQVKVRGYRVEPGEVEAVLERHPGVGECVVTVKEGASGERRLVAYVVPRTPGQWPESAELAAHLSAALPPYMLPSDYVRLAALPLTPTNKIDREALPPPDGSRRELSSSYAGPRTPMEQVIAGVWASVLKRDQVGVHDDFFSLGGHSLLATMLISRLRAELRVDLPLRSLFEAPTVAGLAAEIGRRQGQAESDEAMLLRELEDLSDEEAQRLLLGGSREAAG